jgi:hypothetical protein
MTEHVVDGTTVYSSDLSLSVGDTISIINGGIFRVNSITPNLGSDSVGTYAIYGTGNANGTIHIDDGGVLNILSGVNASASWTVSDSGTIYGHAGGIVDYKGSYANQFRGSQWDAVNRVVLGDSDVGSFIFRCTGSGKLDIGSIGYPTTTQIAGKNFQLQNVGTINAWLECDLENFDIDEDCGVLTVSATNYATTTNMRIVDGTFHQSSSSTPYLSIAGFSADPTGGAERVISGLRMASPLSIGDCGGVTMEDVVWVGDMQGGGVGYRCKSMESVLLVLTDALPGTAINAYKDCPVITTESDNPHLMPGNCDFDGCSFEHYGTISTDFGDAIIGQNLSKTITIKNSICISPSIVFLTMGGGSGLKVISYNNLFVQGVNIGETEASYTDEIKLWANNICLTDGSEPPLSSAKKQIGFQSGTESDDCVTIADYNCSPNCTDPYLYSSHSNCYAAIPGGNDDNRDPDFADSTRTILTYAVSLGCPSGDTVVNKIAYVINTMLARTVSPADYLIYLRQGYTSSTNLVGAGNNIDGYSLPAYIGPVEPVAKSKNWVSIIRLSSQLSMSIGLISSVSMEEKEE